MNDPKSTLSQTDYEQLQTLFEEVVEIPTSERPAHLQQVCQKYPRLEQQLKSLLQHDEGDEEVAEMATMYAPSDRPEAEGTREIAGYVLLEEIGRGGMGVVYKARQLSPDRIVALKMIRVGRFASQEDVRRFSNEVDAIAKLAHDGIVPIYEIGCHHGEHFYTMQLIEGVSFDQYLASEDFNESDAIVVFSELCNAVAFCHEHGVIHRDLKPSNVLLDRQFTPKLTDFGLAKHLERESDLTRTGEVMGTPGYMAPEQADDSTAVVDERADVYGLGAILYRIVTGRPPINTSDVNIVGAIKLVADNDVIAPKLLNRSLSRDLETICLKCLEGDPRKRYRNGGELAEDVRHYLEGDAITARPLTMSRRVMRWARQQPGLAVTWFVVAIFYVYHAICVYWMNMESITPEFHRVATVIAVVWAGGAYFFQRRLLHGRGAGWNLYGWTTMDVVLVNLLLWNADYAQSALVVLLLVLAAASVLRFRPDLVVFVTTLCFASYLLHVWLTFHVADRIDSVELRDSAPVALSILCIGTVQYFALRRSRAVAELATKRASERQRKATLSR